MKEPPRPEGYHPGIRDNGPAFGLDRVAARLSFCGFAQARTQAYELQLSEHRLGGPAGTARKPDAGDA